MPLYGHSDLDHQLLFISWTVACVSAQLDYEQHEGFHSQRNIPHTDGYLQIFVGGKFSSERERTHAHLIFLHPFHILNYFILGKELVTIVHIRVSKEGNGTSLRD